MTDDTSRLAQTPDAAQIRKRIKRIDRLFFHIENRNIDEAHRELHELAHEFEALFGNGAVELPSREQLIRTICCHALCDLQHAKDTADAILELSGNAGAVEVEPVAWQFRYKNSVWQNTHTDCKPDFTLKDVEYRPLYAAPLPATQGDGE